MLLRPIWCSMLLLTALGCTAAGEPVGKFVGHEGQVVTATFSRDGAHLASIGDDGTIRVWDVASQRELARAAVDPPPRQITTDQIAFSPDGQSLAFAAADSEVQLCRWRTDDPPQTLMWMTAPPVQVRFTPDGSRVVAAGGGYAQAGQPVPGVVPTLHPLDVRVFDLHEGRQVAALDDTDLTPNSVAISPDGRRFAVTTMVVNGKPVRAFPVAENARGFAIVREILSGRCPLIISTSSIMI